MFVGCDDLFEPAIENNLGFEYMYDNSEYADGLLGNAYTRIPSSSYTFNDVATDDAVSNDANNGYRKMAEGSWMADNNPTDRWGGCRAAIQYLNLFLANVDKVNWVKDKVVATMYNDRVKGEAYALRAMYMYHLLQAHAGYSASGELLGIPILTEPEDKNSNFNLPRNTFEECMQAIYSDINKALELLPTEFADIEDDNLVPAKYKAIGATAAQYTRANGKLFVGRMSGKIAEAIRSHAALMAASPAFAEGTTTTWAKAADYAAIVLNRINGVAGLDPTGATWYANVDDIKNMGAGSMPAEILWRTEKSSDYNAFESDNYPPSIWGNGRINPTQNLVDAFPMANGYPITDTAAGFDASNPYDNRDPRLSAYIVYNGSTVGVNNTVIHTAADYVATDNSQKDVLNNTVGVSTRTGYYLRKLLRQDVNLDPNAASKQEHYKSRIRYTEIFLNYAEAANEAYGPTGKGSQSYSAYDVVKALRSRAGVGKENGDAYLESIKGDKEKMRQLIHNERRLELCFEGVRFWDLRRWKESITDTAKGVNITGNTHTTIDVDARNFKDYMYYGPIPYSEVLKFNALEQNKGW
ncbi:RagB/SusD family nutrient uptake outer membrane protein [Bacteroides sp. OttesenSCG-928-J23]|nr:RagB/SusD family nutrient uptake outer membrane protein [Bacteroides sp. OttesenSCG-928-J23]